MSIRAAGLAAFACLVIGLIIGSGVVSARGPSSTAKPYVVEGHVDVVNSTGDAIGLAESQEAGSLVTGYVIAGAVWRQGGQAWNASFPTCLEAGSGGQRVRLGVVHTDPSSEIGGRPVVVWLECLS